MATADLNRDGTQLTVVTRTLPGGSDPRQFFVRMAASLPALGIGNEANYIGEFEGDIRAGTGAELYQFNFDWLNGGVIRVLGTSITVNARRQNANVASPLTIQVAAEILETEDIIDQRNIARPQFTQLLAATGQGAAAAVGTIPLYAKRIIGVYGTLVAAGAAQLSFRRNDDVTIVGAQAFTQVNNFGAVDLPIPTDATRIFMAETNNGAGDNVTNVRVVYELEVP